jgi:hypothetical protein
MVTLQVVPDTVVQPAAHPPNVCPLLGVAVSTTVEPDANAAEHVTPQLMPDGELTMTPFALRSQRRKECELGNSDWQGRPR